MRSAKDFQAGRAAQLRAHHAVEGPGVRSREVYSSLAKAWKSTNVVVGATFLLGSKAPVHRKHRNFRVLPAFFSTRNLTAEAGKQGHRGRIRGPRLGSQAVRGRGQTCFVRPEKIRAEGSESLPRAAVCGKTKPGGPATAPTGIHLPPAETFLRRSIPRRYDAIPDRAPRAKSIASPPGTARL